MIIDMIVATSYAGRDHNVKTGFAQVGQLRALRLFRLLRIVRVLRALRMARQASELRKLSYTLRCSCRMVFWSLGALVFVMYFFAVLFTQAATEALLNAGSNTLQMAKLQLYY